MKSIIDIANDMLMSTSITYKQISADTGLSYKWLEGFNYRYKKGLDFHVRKVEKLISYLTNKAN